MSRGQSGNSGRRYSSVTINYLAFGSSIHQNSKTLNAPSTARVTFTWANADQVIQAVVVTVEVVLWSILHLQKKDITICKAEQRLISTYHGARSDESSGLVPPFFRSSLERARGVSLWLSKGTLLTAAVILQNNPSSDNVGIEFRGVDSDMTCARLEIETRLLVCH